MVQTGWLAPFAQIGRELRIELNTSFRESGLASRGRRARTPVAAVLPEQRIDDERIVEQRKADAFLLSVRHGAVRR